MAVVLYAVIVVVLLLVLAYKRVFAVPKELVDLPPPPSWWFLYDFFVKRTSLEERSKKYRDYAQKAVKRLFFFGRWEVIFNHPDFAREVYTNTDVFRKFLVQEEVSETLNAKFFGINLVFSNGEEWKKQHKVISPAFQTKNLVKIANKVFPDCVRLVFDTQFAKIDDKPIDIHNWTQRFTLDVLGRAGFSYDMKSIVDPEAEHVVLYNRIIKGLTNPLFIVFPFVNNLPIKSIRDILADMKRFDDFLYSVVEERIKTKKLQKDSTIPEEDKVLDLLDLMLSSSEFNAKELRDNLVIFFLAGHDTTANSLSITTYFLAKYPEIQEKARREALEIFRKSSSGGDGDEATRLLNYVPSFEDQKQMEFLTAIIKEGLRLYPSVVILPARLTSKEVTLEAAGTKVTLPKNTLCTVDILNMQRNPEFWGEDCEEYIPERFLPLESPWASLDHYKDPKKKERQPTRNDHPMVFSAFGASHRSCIGQQFSMIEQRMFLGTLLLRYDLSLTPGCEELHMSAGALLHPIDLHITFKRRF